MALRHLPAVIDHHLILDHEGSTLPAIVVGSPAWFTWLMDDQPRSFHFRHPHGSFTARRERKHQQWYWYAYRRVDGKLQRAYLGKPIDLTLDRLVAVATAFAHRSAHDGARDGQPPTLPADHALTTTGQPAGPPAFLLRTKLTVPPLRAERVTRRRLQAQLATALHVPLTLVIAPAGWGKTTVLSDWVQQLSCPVAWLSLDQGDNDPVHFLAYLSAALDILQPGCSAPAFAMLRTPQPPPAEAVLTPLINALATLDTDVVLVLDDYHLLTEAAIHDALWFLVNYLPSRVHLVIAGRTELPVPLAGLRARDHLRELGAADLRFLPDEAAAFLTQVMRLPLQAADITTLEARTEGWIAGLHLAALALQGHVDPHAAVERFAGSHRYIVDYLVEEVLERQPPAVQRFLLHTSILDRLCAPLCTAVMAGTSEGAPAATLDAVGSGFSSRGAQDMVEYLEQANLFLVPLDDERHWYRYHQLFAAALRERLQQMHPEGVPALYYRAADWHEQHGFMDEAIHYLLLAGDFKRVALLVEKVGWLRLMHGQFVLVHDWLMAFPAVVMRTRPRLCLIQAWALLLTHDLVAVESSLQEVEAALGLANDAHTADRASQVVEQEAILGEVAAIRAQLACLRGDAINALMLAQQARSAVHPDAVLLRGMITEIMGEAYTLNGDIIQASDVYAEAVAFGRAADNLYTVITTMHQLAFIQIIRGQLRAAVATFQQGLRMAGADTSRQGSGHGLLMPMTGILYVGMAIVLREWNDLDAAERLAQMGADLLEPTRSLMMYAYLQLARVRYAQGDLDGALVTLQRADEAIPNAEATRISRDIALIRTRIHLAQGNLTAAAEWVQTYDVDAGEHSAVVRPVYLRDHEHLTLARVLLAQRRNEEAMTLLAQLKESTMPAGRTARVIEGLALEALAYQAQGEHEQALTTLGQALRLAEPEGFIRTFVDEGEPMAALLQLARAHAIFPVYAGRLLAAFPPEHLPATAVAAHTLLSERERKVVRLLAAGRSNAEIAQQMVLAESSVKTYLRRIYRKLGVRSRTQAVARAGALDLL
jgi:LuxR family maltose regulon positive regulatory protein